MSAETKPQTEETIDEPTELTQDIGEATDAALDEQLAQAGIDLGQGQELARLQEENAQMRDQLLRAVAETENLRRRAERDMQETGKYAVTGFARDLVQVAEILQRAAESISEEQRAANPQLKNLAEGVEMTQRELLNAFQRHGIRRIDPIGQPFDHNLHQAVVQIDTPDAEAGTVVQVMQAGYVIHDRLLKPAMVGVAKGSAPAKPAVDTTA